MSDNQTDPSIVHMNIDNYAMGANTSNIINNYLTPLHSTEIREDYDNQITFPNFPNQVQEALTIVKKFLARQPSNHEVKINKEGVMVNGKPFEIDYEACKICKHQPSTLICRSYQRKIYSVCIVKRSKEVKCLRCKNAKKNKDKLAFEFEDKIERLLSLESNDKTKEMVLVEVENLAGKNLEELIEVVRKLELKKDKVDRSISIAYFYVGKIFYERMEEFFSEESSVEKEKNRKILGSFKHAKELDFGV
ncbi:MAG: hypothetical protein I3270_01385 [Candidatus Moeniiplasma glomeromycotorum]|nr:hypothetical protein [Candidatus Moeniiplasma glomeromycotorum]MCE8162361.1 hypothetical protein [Candidatus Moeniiplasma glomeromycotorum]MCE8166285.1 hypothetical protein [Candidatus Moeniiplasma glomeromycotorum]MCE8166767.1 hypothetical protein [Candidatus Moeniiplasma glomeromycotorum]